MIIAAPRPPDFLPRDQLDELGQRSAGLPNKVAGQRTLWTSTHPAAHRTRRDPDPLLSLSPDESEATTDVPFPSFSFADSRPCTPTTGTASERRPSPSDTLRPAARLALTLSPCRRDARLSHVFAPTCLNTATSRPAIHQSFASKGSLRPFLIKCRAAGARRRSAAGPEGTRRQRTLLFTQQPRIHTDPPGTVSEPA